MTTVAWDGRTLVGDTQCTREQSLRSRVETKVWRINSPDGPVLMGVAGNYGHALALREWLESGGSEETKPSIPSDELGLCMLVMGGKPFLLETGLFPARIIEPFFAIGSGRDFALAAMRCGKSAREAVEIACEYDIYSSAPFTEVTLEP